MHEFGRFQIADGFCDFSALNEGVSGVKLATS
jgi:hypothetical protein